VKHKKLKSWGTKKVQPDGLHACYHGERSATNDRTRESPIPKSKRGENAAEKIGVLVNEVAAEKKEKRGLVHKKRQSENMVFWGGGGDPEVG